MSKIAIVKISDEDLTEDEGLGVIQEVLDKFGLKATILRDEPDEDNNGPRFWNTLATDEHRADMVRSQNDLHPIVDERYGGIIAYVMLDHLDDITSMLNGSKTPSPQ